MKRTQLYLEEHQKKVLEERSRATGKSMGQLVREAVDEVYLRTGKREKRIAKKDPLWGYIGRGQSKEKDVSTRHDHYLYGPQE